jgi:nucleoside-diphosphate-sugar epimerase
MKVLITGGLGFQGSHLAQALLNRGDEVTVLSTPTGTNYGRLLILRPFDAPSDGRFRMVAGSVTEPEILEKTVPGHTHVVHMAASASVDASLARPWPAIEVNILGTAALLDTIRKFSETTPRVVIASSCEVYGPLRAGGPPLQDEATPMEPRSPYAASKVAADRLAYAYAITFGFDLTILRPCNVYGPSQRAGALGAVIPTFARAALLKHALHVTGDGKQSREFLHVDDLVRAYLAVLDGPPNPPGTTYNVGSGDVWSIRDLAYTIRDLVNPDARVLHTQARTADVSGFCLDWQRFAARYAWAPRVAFKEGLADYCRGLKLSMGQA